MVFENKRATVADSFLPPLGDTSHKTRTYFAMTFMENAKKL